MIVEIFFYDSESAVFPALMSVISVIPLVIGFFKVIWKSMKSLFKKPSANVDELSSVSNLSLIEENENDSNNDTEKNHELKQSILDPCGIRNQIEYFNFLDDPDVNHFDSFFRIRKCNVKMIPGIIYLIIAIVYMVFDVITSLILKNNILCIFIRIIFYFFSIPFIMIFNVTSLFFDNKKLTEKHSYIQKLWIIVLVAYLAILLICGLSMVYINLKFSVFIPKNLVYKNATGNITTSAPASICETEYYGLSLLQYAGIASTGQTKDSKLAGEISKYIFDGSELPMKTIDLNFTFFHVFRVKQNFGIIAFNSISDINSLAFLLENYINDFLPNQIMSALVPFYNLLHEIFIGKFINIISEMLISLAGVPTITKYYINLNQKFGEEFQDKNITLVITGHSVGGLLAKGEGVVFHYPSISFQSLNYYHSFFSADVTTYEAGIESKTNGFQMINVYSPSQILAQAEINSTMNIKLPKWKGSMGYINSYETACLIAAGCAEDDRYDAFCDSIMGLDQYKHLFSLWNRTRSDYHNE